MAGPLSSEEIEDVVSSVRRLVSNEQRVKTRDLNSEKLVLTSVYRVVPETGPLSPASPPPLRLDSPLVEPPPTAAPEAEVAQEPPAPAPGEAVEGSLAQALAGEPELAQVDMAASDGEPQTSEVPDAPFIDTVEAEWEDEIWTEPTPVSLGEAALAAEEAEVLMPPEPDPLQDVGAAAEPAAPEATDSTVTDAPLAFVPLRRRAEDLAGRVAAGAVVEPPTDEAPAPEASPAQPEDPLPAVEDHASEPEPADSAAEETPADATPPEVAAPRASDPAPLATDLYDADGTPLAVLDEAALNEIVRQVLRAELQGELGERITRNVRKLVRAEINRALMARDLD